MMTKTAPFTKSQIETLAKEYPTPLYVYDAVGILETAQRVNKAFAWNEGYQNFYAIKALPNPYIFEVLQSQGQGMDCSSLGELEMAKAVGCEGEDIMFSSNDTPRVDFERALELGAIINFDDISHIDYFSSEFGRLPEIGCCRYNPGPLKPGPAVNFIGDPAEVKYGFTLEQLVSGYQKLQEQGVRRFGIHTMVVSNDLHIQSLLDTYEMLFDAMMHVHRKLGIIFEFINFGGGVGIPYLPSDSEVDIEVLAQGTKELYDKKVIESGHPDLKIFTEFGRCMTGPHGYLVTRAIHKKETYKNYIGSDASMANLMRPGMYGAYHHITVLGKEDTPETNTYDVTGSLCENNDKFAIDRLLPEIEIGDLLVIHDAGAHSHCMGFQYNAKLRSAEFVLHEDGSFTQIRRAETLDDYFATLDYPGLS